MTKGTQQTTSAVSTTFLSMIEQPLMLAYGASNLIITGWSRQRVNLFQVKTAYRTFVANPSRPNGWTAVGAAINPSATATGGEFCESKTISGLSGVMWIQGAIFGGLSGGAPGEAETFVRCVIETQARVVAAKMFQIEPDVNTNKIAVIPFGPPVPSLGLTGAMVAGTITGVNGTAKLNFCSREFTGDASSPGAWSAGLLQAGDANITADGDYNSGDMTITPSVTPLKSLLQLGLMVPANDARATLDFTLAVKY